MSHCQTQNTLSVMVSAEDCARATGISDHSPPSETLNSPQGTRAAMHKASPPIHHASCYSSPFPLFAALANERVDHDGRKMSRWI
jgi:hypothetical protein